MTKILLTFLVSSLLLACSVSRPGTARLYAAPTDPPCVKELWAGEVTSIPAKIRKKSLGFFDFRDCEASDIGLAWVKEKRLRQKYEKQVGILND